MHREAMVAHESLEERLEQWLEHAFERPLPQAFGDGRHSLPEGLLEVYVVAVVAQSYVLCRRGQKASHRILALGGEFAHQVNRSVGYFPGLCRALEAVVHATRTPLLHLGRQGATGIHLCVAVGQRLLPRYSTRYPELRHIFQPRQPLGVVGLLLHGGKGLLELRQHHGLCFLPVRSHRLRERHGRALSDRGNAVFEVDEPQAVELLHLGLALLRISENEVAAGTACRVSHGPRVVLEAVDQGLQQGVDMRRDRLALHLLRELGDARTGRLAHGVVVRRCLRDVELNDFPDVLCHELSSIGSHRHAPGLLRVDTHSLGHVVTVDAHRRQQDRKILLRESVLHRAGQHVARSDARRVPHLAPVVREPLGQKGAGPLRQGLEGFDVTRGRDGGCGVERDLAHEAIRVHRRLLEQPEKGVVDVFAKVLLSSGDDRPKSTERGLQRFPSLRVVHLFAELRLPSGQFRRLRHAGLYRRSEDNVCRF
mmetsp:Transcript_24847/g.46446  ORF Transcript_24847/g.46446 Transcript_24847/m.46446 type:complete len:481 (-) Transcript_24847:422-1864(-)